MDVILCKICSRKFNGKEIEPRLLKCGHYFCYPCIRSLGVPSKCPECQSDVSFEQCSNIPVNFYVLNILLTKGAIPLWISAPLILLEKYLESVHVKLKDYVVHYDRVTSMRSLLDDTKNKIHELNFLQILELMEDFNKYLDSVENFLNKKEREFAISKELKNFSCPDDFIRSIISGLEEHEVFIAAHRIGKEIKYGKLTIDNHFRHTLFVHSLTETDFERGASIVWFQDIKSCINEKNVMTFLDIPSSEDSTASNRLVFVMMEGSALATQFIKICSGECDKTYKGVSFTKNNSYVDTVMSVNGYMCDGTIQNKPIDYDLGLCVEAKRVNNVSVPGQFIDKNCLLLQAISDGSFKTVKYLDEETDLKAASDEKAYENIIGVTAEESNVKNSYTAIIEDCGIAIASSLQLAGIIFYDVYNEKFRDLDINLRQLAQNN